MPENTQISIMGTDGTLIYCNQDSDVLIPENALTEVLENVPEGIACYYDYEEKHFLIQKNELSSGLTMLTVLPSDIIRTMSTQMLATLLVLLAVTLVVGVVLMLTLSSAIVAPIVQLSQQMEKGVIELVNDRRYSGDEIDILYCRYNQMQKKIQEMLRDIWNSAEKQKNAELRLLQAQINPHFVYNTLGTISCQALLAGENLIAEQLNMLAQIMRYSTRDPNSLVPLEKEIQITRQYVQIQELNNKNVEFVFSVSAECNNVLIPKLIIQPLVENSIIHGMYPGKNNGRIAIDVQARESGIITITVSDNGCGVDAEAINNYIRGKAKMHADHDSLGVKNVYDRIRNVYGDNGKLEYRMSLSRETLAIIEIKLE